MRYFLPLIAVFISSCASYKYDNKYNDNKVEIRTNFADCQLSTPNVDQYSAPYGSQGKVITIHIPKVKKKNLKLCITGDKYDTVYVNLERTVRASALTKDIVIGIFTFGIPVLIDVFNSDLYKLKKNSKFFNIELEFSQTYMSAELLEILKDNDTNIFIQYIKNFPKSALVNVAVDKKDSLELNNSIERQSELAIDEYIYRHPKSKFLFEAQKIQNEMVASREAFTLAKSINTVISYEEFLTKFPTSLFNVESKILLVDAAEKDAIASNNLNAMLNYVKNYLFPNLNVLDLKENQKKLNNISELIDNALIREYDSKIETKKYNDYSKLWKRYIEIKSKLLALPELKSTENYRIKICNLLFKQLQLSDSKEKQTSLVNQINIDFPSLKKVGLTFRGDTSNINTVTAILTNLTEVSGIVKLFNVGFLKYYATNSISSNAIIGFKTYQYQGSIYNSLENYDYEELSFINGNLDGNILLKLQKDNVLISKEKNGIISEVSFYHLGALLKTMYYEGNTSLLYEYEFENGINLSLKVLDGKIKDVQQLIKDEQFLTAINNLNYVCANNYPQSIPQNITINTMLKQASIKQENKEKQEEIKQENNRRQEEKKRKEEENKTYQIGEAAVCDNLD
jgi:hypothetical protein